MPATAVKVVAGRPGGELARRVEAELRRGGHPVTVDPDLTSADGVLVFVDDPALPEAYARLTALLPGRSIFPNTILVVAEVAKAGGLVGEGFRDVTSVAGLSAAVEALLRGRPPTLFAALRNEIEHDFLPKFVAEMRQRAKEKQAMVAECIELMRASAYLEKRIYRLRKVYFRQATDELITQDGRIDAYLHTVDETKRHRLGRLPAFPATDRKGSGIAGSREPRFRRAREEIGDAIDWLRQAGHLRALGKAGTEAMNETATTLEDKPLQGLRDCLNIVEREIALRLTQIERIQAQVNPIGVLEERCLDRYGFQILPPGIVVPAAVHTIVSAAVQPIAELYPTWCLDLRDLKVKQFAEVMADIARDLAWSREPTRTTAPRARRAPERDTFEQDTQPLGGR